MTYMTLRETYCVGLKSIDEEHGELMDLINQIHEALQASAPLDAVRTIFQRLAACAATHFCQEEAFFARTGYPEAALHAHQHEHLMMVVACFQNGVDRTGRPVSLDEQLAFVRDWLLDHIANEDHEFADYLSSHERPVLSVAA